MIYPIPDHLINMPNRTSFELDRNSTLTGSSQGIFLGRILAFIKNVPPRDNCPWQVALRALSLWSEVTRF